MSTPTPFPGFVPIDLSAETPPLRSVRRDNRPVESQPIVDRPVESVTRPAAESQPITEPVYCFSTLRDRPFASHLLTYMAQRLKGESCRRHDFVSSTRLSGTCLWTPDVEEDDESQEHCFELGEGVHRVWYEGRLLTVTVTVAASDEIRELIKQTSYGATMLSKQVSVSGVQDEAQMQALVKEASAYVGSLLRHDEGVGRRVQSWVYDSRELQFARMGYQQPRDPRSLFLKAGQRESLLGVVGDFLNSKADYERCSVPYKLNLFLHGVPGTGKTSVIRMLASHFGLNVAIIPFSPRLTDDMLARALSSARGIGCTLIALEDVDCVFDPSRKPGDAAAASLTLSGLLNCMDGMLRGAAKGLIMVLTANVVDRIDEAVLRTARVDFALEFTHADKYQALSCFKYYAEIFDHTFTDAEWAAFWEGVSCHQFSTALLQQYFFQARRDRQQFLDVDRFKRLTRSTGKEGAVVGEKKRWFYS
jgi:hypothetical protein